MVRLLFRLVKTRIMKSFNKLFNRLLLSAAVVILSTLLSFSAKAQTNPDVVKNILLVHGAFADGSGWRGVYNILVAKGYHVTVVPNPVTSLEDDVAAVNRALVKVEGSVILVGHSYGGAVISQAGADPKVVGLVYVAGFQPKVGETCLDLVKTDKVLPENGILAPDENGFLFYDREKFHIGFAAGLSKAESDFMYDSQAPISLKAFTTPLTQAAWTTKPSWGIVATEDKSINPEIERSMYKRSGAVVTEIKASHVVYMTKAKEVADVIIEASKKSLLKK